MNNLVAFADYFAGASVPFGFHITPLYVDPLGVHSGGVPAALRLADSPAIIGALVYMQNRGGVMVEHGLTHQYSSTPNPYDAVSGDDAEFFRQVLGSDGSLVSVGPVAEDSQSWAAGRFAQAEQELAAAGFPAPSLTTFPHYVASPSSYAAAAQFFATRMERALYFSGQLSGALDPTRFVGQFFPYSVRDVYGTKVLADTLGQVQPVAAGGAPARLPADIIADAQRTRVVRDGIAAFFFNPRDDISYLQQTVEGIKNLGYTFVDPRSL